jgi:hypothetical protein
MSDHIIVYTSLEYLVGYLVLGLVFFVAGIVLAVAWCSDAWRRRKVARLAGRLDREAIDREAKRGGR